MSRHQRARDGIARPRRELAALALSIVVCLTAIFMVRLHVALGPPTQRIYVRWAEGVSNAQRERLEDELGLDAAEWREQRTWSYLLANRSRAKIAVLLAHPSVEDTQHLDRANLRVQLDRPGMPAWLRRVAETDLLPYVSVVLGVGGLLGTWRFRHVVRAPARASLDVVLMRMIGPMVQMVEAVTARRYGWLALLVAMPTSVVLVLTAGSQIFDSNHYALTEATALQAGDHPYRDFFEVGIPLAAYMAAGTQLLSGYRLIGEFARQWAFIVAGVVIAFDLGLRLSRSRAATLAVLPLTLLILAGTPTYHYSKLFFVPLIVWAGWRYIDAPSARRSALLGLVTAIAFLFRHDYGVYLGFASVVAFGLACVTVPSPGRRRTMMNDGLAFATTIAVIIAPWAVVVQMNEGLLEYARVRAALYQGSEPVYASLLGLSSLRELKPTTPPEWSRLSGLAWTMSSRQTAVLWLQLMAVLSPLLLLVSVGSTLWRRGRHAMASDAWATMFAALFLVALDNALIRQPSYVVTVAPLTAALSARLVAQTSRLGRVCAALVVTSTTIAAVAWVRDTSVFDPIAAVRSGPAVLGRLMASPPEYDSRLSYIRDCTVPGDRVLVTGSSPLHVSYYTQRPIAGGHINWRHSWRADPGHEAQSLALLQEQSVPFAIATNDPVMVDFRPYPRIHEYLTRYYAELEGTGGLLLIDTRRAVMSRYGPQGLPCFRPVGS
jgi:hypothetical protein